MSVTRTVREAVATCVWLLPASRTKNSLLRGLGADVHPTARIRPNLVRNVGRITIGPGARIDAGNVIKGLRALTLSQGASIGRFNLISSHPAYRKHLAGGACVELDEQATISSRHTIDCAGSLRLETGAMIAGHGSTVLTHSLDLRRNAQTAYPVVVGANTFVGAHCLLLAGATMPPRSVLAAGSVLTKTTQQRDPGLWAGVPAIRKGDVSGEWFTRSGRGTRRVFVPATGEVVENAF